MKIGLVNYWFDRGQAVVARYLRDSLDKRGYETYVLARPTKEAFARPQFIDSEGVWAQERVTHASHFDIPSEEYFRWVEDNQIDTLLFDQNYQFETISQLRAAGVRTVGRFVWEAFKPEHVAGARQAFDSIYSFTRCERKRYAGFGIDSPYIPFGCNPELLHEKSIVKPNVTTFFYPGGYLARRKPTGAVIEAFSRVPDLDARLVIKTQCELTSNDLIKAETMLDLSTKNNFYSDSHRVPETICEMDPRITIVSDNLEPSHYHALFRSADICVAPSRWEGLGLHLYEAVAFGVPILTNDIPPVNEMVEHGRNGHLVSSTVIGRTVSGVEAYEPDVDELANAFRELVDPVLRARLEKGAAEVLAERPWSVTIDGIEKLLK